MVFSSGYFIWGVVSEFVSELVFLNECFFQLVVFYVDDFYVSGRFKFGVPLKR